MYRSDRKYALQESSNLPVSNFHAQSMDVPPEMPGTHAKRSRTLPDNSNFFLRGLGESRNCSTKRTYENFIETVRNDLDYKETGKKRKKPRLSNKKVLILDDDVNEESAAATLLNLVPGETPKKGRKPKKFSEASKRQKNNEFRKLDKRVEDVPDIVKNEWHESRIDKSKQALMDIGMNIVVAEKTLPKTSPARTALIQAATAGVNGAICADLFGKCSQSIYNAKETEPKFSELHLDAIPRDKLALKIPSVVKFFAPLQTKSGRNFRVYYGGPKKCYEKYLEFCSIQKFPNLKDNEIIQSAAVFHRERKKQL
jgi:hypothetical protein